MTAWDTVPNTVLTLFSAAHYLTSSILHLFRYIQQFYLKFLDVFHSPVIYFWIDMSKPILKKKIWGKKYLLHVCDSMYVRDKYIF